MFRLSTLVIIFSASLLLFICEVLQYYYHPSWKNIDCKNPSKCTKIMLVADPQIIGEKNEVIHSLTPLAIWDSDRYLSRTFAIAESFINPNYVIYLGDLLDEGSSVLNDDEYVRYKDRFYNIFRTKSNKIYIPGDNDIGGEVFDFITPLKVARFEKNFPQDSVIIDKNITFIRVNELTNNIPSVAERKNEIRIALSHKPLLYRPGPWTHEFFQLITIVP